MIMEEIFTQMISIGKNGALDLLHDFVRSKSKPAHTLLM